MGLGQDQVEAVLDVVASMLQEEQAGIRTELRRSLFQRRGVTKKYLRWEKIDLLFVGSAYQETYSKGDF